MTEIPKPKNKTYKFLFILGILSPPFLVFLNVFSFLIYAVTRGCGWGWFGEAEPCNPLLPLILLLLISIVNLALIITDIIVLKYGKKNVNIKFSSYAKGNLVSYVVTIFIISVFVVFTMTQSASQVNY